MFLVTRDGVEGDVAFELRRLTGLLEDLTRIAEGHRPGAELADAPFLDDYAPTFRMDPCLTGLVQGHPSVRGPAVLTSALWAYSPELGFARTLSRYYRLGRPLTRGGAHEP